MTREQAIQEIEQLFPPDAEYPATAVIGQQLLDQAKRNCQKWRDEPDDVIFELLRLNRERDSRGILG